MSDGQSYFDLDGVSFSIDVYQTNRTGAEELKNEVFGVFNSPKFRSLIWSEIKDRTGIEDVKAIYVTTDGSQHAGFPGQVAASYFDDEKNEIVIYIDPDRYLSVNGDRISVAQLLVHELAHWVRGVGEDENLANDLMNLINDIPGFVFVGVTPDGFLLENGDVLKFSFPPPRCFAAGTMVKLADGTERPIETIAVSDEVLAFDHGVGFVSRNGIVYAERRR